LPLPLPLLSPLPFLLSFPLGICFCSCPSLSFSDPTLHDKRKNLFVTNRSSVFRSQT